MIRFKLGSLIVRATLLELAGFLMILLGLGGIYAQSLSFREAAVLIFFGVLFMQDRYYLSWLERRLRRRMHSQESGPAWPKTGEKSEP
jgi:hypothetical protein